jgi:hypothetical protein
VVLRTEPGQVDREIYRSSGEIPGDVVVSAEGLYVSFVEFLPGQSGSSLTQLVILDLAGQVIRKIQSEEGRGIRGYVWCCGVGKIALLRGSNREDQTFRPETLSIVDAATGMEEPLQGIWRPYQMHWAAFDSSLYVKVIPRPGEPGSTSADFIVYRYHLPTRQLSLTSRHGVFFSPDGLYYYDAATEEPGFRVFGTADDRDITSIVMPPENEVALRPTGDWMPGEGHVLLFIETQPHPAQPGRARRSHPVRLDARVPQIYPDRWNRAVDAENGRVIERFQGDIGAGWKTNARELPVERGIGVEIVRPHGP